MILPNELRIGNLVNGVMPGGAPSRVNTTLLLGIEKGLLVAEPISLAPEILEKAGVVYPSRGDSHGGVLLPISEAVSIRIKQNISGSGYYWDNFNGSHKVIINHLHQLQNLYFALTGEELPIEL